MISKSFAILFYLKKRTGVEQQKLPVYLRITVDGERRDIHTQQVWEEARWNKQAQRAKGTNEQSPSINAYLDALERDIQNAQVKLSEAGQPITVSEIEKILTGQEDKPITLLGVFKEHNDKMRALVNTEYAEGTIERYKTTYDHVSRFIAWKYGAKDIELKSLSFSFVSDLEFWLKSERKCGHNSAIRYIANLRKIINICLKNGGYVDSIIQRVRFFIATSTVKSSISISDKFLSTIFSRLLCFITVAAFAVIIGVVLPLARKKSLPSH